jgi:NADH-quinone oxidoreductase subunit H
MTLLNLFVAAIWRFMGDGILRWIVCSAILIGVYVVVGTIEMRRKKIGPRTYRYAE